MIKLENTEVLGWEHVIRGMRNPMNSWDKSDSFYYAGGGPSLKEAGVIDPVTGRHEGYEIGDNDHDLMMRLAKGGPVHSKYRRMITVYVDITAPLYWWKEFDTYKVGTVANSCSTMHKIHAKEFVLDDFSYEKLLNNWDNDDDLVEFYNYEDTALSVLEHVIEALNHFRELFLKTKDKKYWEQMIQLLPSSYNQKRTIMLNYEVLHNIYYSRKNHKLDEWHAVCAWIESLPYSEIISLETKEKTNEN